MNNTLTRRSKWAQIITNEGLRTQCHQGSQDVKSETNDEEILNKLKIRQIPLFYFTGSIFFQNFKFIKVNEKPRKCSILKETKEMLQLTTVGPWTTRGLEVPIFLTVESLQLALQWSMHIWSSVSSDSTNCGPCSTVVCIQWKKSLYTWTHEVQTHVIQGSAI